MNLSMHQRKSRDIRVWRFFLLALAALLAAFSSLQALIVWGYPGFHWQLTSTIFFVFALPAVILAIWFPLLGSAYLWLLPIILLFEMVRSSSYGFGSLGFLSAHLIIALFTSFATTSAARLVRSHA